MIFGGEGFGRSETYLTPRKVEGSSETKRVTPPKDKDIPWTISDLKTRIIEAAGSCSSQSTFPCLLAENIGDDMFDEVMKQLEADPAWRCVACKMAYISGDIFIVEYPSLPHEVIKGKLGNMIVAYNIQNTQRDSNPLSNIGSTRVRYGHNTRLEADQSFLNCNTPRDAKPRDPSGVVIPSIVFEVACSETYGSVQRTAEVYLSSPHVQMVVSIKALMVGDRFSQLYCITHSRGEGVNEQALAARRVISFGPRAQAPSIEAILCHTGVAEENFVGIGRHGLEA
eukprot:gene31113-37600_t